LTEEALDTVAAALHDGEIVSDALGGVIPAPVAAVVYAATLGGFIYAAPSNLLERFNNTLVAVVLGTFLPLLLIAGSAVEPTNLVDHSQWGGVPNTIPVIALAFGKEHGSAWGTRWGSAGQYLVLPSPDSCTVPL